MMHTLDFLHAQHTTLRIHSLTHSTLHWGLYLKGRGLTVLIIRVFSFLSNPTQPSLPTEPWVYKVLWRRCFSSPGYRRGQALEDRVPLASPKHACLGVLLKYGAHQVGNCFSLELSPLHLVFVVEWVDGWVGG